MYMLCKDVKLYSVMMYMYMYMYTLSCKKIARKKQHKAHIDGFPMTLVTFRDFMKRHAQFSIKNQILSKKISVERLIMAPF